MNLKFDIKNIIIDGHNPIRSKFGKKINYREFQYDFKYPKNFIICNNNLFLRHLRAITDNIEDKMTYYNNDTYNFISNIKLLKKYSTQYKDNL
jgi:hypothetical protein